MEFEQKPDERPVDAGKPKKKAKTVLAIVLSLIVVCIATVLLLTKFIYPRSEYNAALELYNAGRYEDAIAAFEALNGYKDSAAQIEKCSNAIKARESALKDQQYAAAVDLYHSGKYDEAIAAFEALNGYKDSADQIANCEAAKKNDVTEPVKAGDHIFLGAYEQDNDTSNGKESIEWLVLACDGNKALVVSKYALDAQEYNISFTDVTWETCTLREWLNDAFLNAAFDSEARNRMISSTVTADENPSYGTSPGNHTTDKVFLLSITEVNKYFSSDETRKCVPTAYAIAQDTDTSSSYTAEEKATCWWWLRTPGDESDLAAYVEDSGCVSFDGRSVFSDCIAVRPAMWISLEP